jgi:4-diphosphocytidyl-2-C-methyl-D-erythritol kinase
MRVRTVAPAKINWTLEVLGKRDDGYHEIRSVMQTIDLCDEVIVEEPGASSQEPGWVRAGSSGLLIEEGHEATDDDLTLQAVRALEKAVGRALPVAIRLVKRIPVASGLGGGSSDAAAVLRAVDRLYGLGLSREKQAGVGATVGSDVPFFVFGGTALAEGRGERVTPLRDVPQGWLVVIAPPLAVPAKTGRVYGALTGQDEESGVRAEELITWLRRGDHVRDRYLHNSLEGAAFKVLAGLSRYRVEFAAVAGGVHLSGAGPSLFSVFGSRRDADSVAEELIVSDARVFVARTLGADEATWVVVD